ncbi:MAG TPA: hypothetical protein VMB80_17675 [Candidatus Acidoferrum sp.]|nr:hypothetical protein [Candidatus Acidoferrum sp.]
MNPIQPIQPPAAPRAINVVEPVSPALEHVKRMLFRPFDLGKWFIIGFCAWLACLGEGGAGSGGGNFNFGNHSHGSGPDIRRALEEARNYLLNNLDWIIPLAALIVLLAIGLGLLFLWLSSRGKFMFLHCVALNRAEVAEPWTRFGTEANSLFLFRLILGLIGMVLTLPLLGIIAVIIIRMIYHGEPDVGGILTAIGIALGFIAVAIVLAIIKKLTEDFVVPIMFLRRSTCLAAWREFYRLLSAHFWQFVLYLLFQIVLAMAIGALIVMVVLITCCCAGCLMALPYLGTVLLLPVLVFKRAYSLYFFAQFGPEYDVFPPPPPVASAPAPGLPPMPVAPPAR